MHKHVETYAIKMVIATVTITVQIELSHFEDALKRKLTEEEADILIQMKIIDIDEFVYTSKNNALPLVKLWAAVESIIGRPMTPDEHKVIEEAYHGFHRSNAHLLEMVTDIARSWVFLGSV